MQDRGKSIIPKGWKEFGSRLWGFIVSWYFLAAVLLIILVAIGLLVSVWQWEWLQGSGRPSGPDVAQLQNDKPTETNSTTLRNVAIIIAGLVAMLFAAWRAKIADSQSKTAQRGLLNERYQKGAEMLGNDVLATRVGGIYALQRLAEEHPVEYHLQIMNLLCSYARHPKISAVKPDDRISEDVQSIMYAIRTCRKKEAALNLERVEQFRLNLTRTHLRGGDLSGINLSNADLPEANLGNAFLGHANLSGAYLLNANLSGAIFTSANLSEANLSGANLTADSLAGNIPITGLTQRQLDLAFAESNNPPSLEAFDAVTSEHLIWNKKPREPNR
jgi:hypothetical protein